MTFKSETNVIDLSNFDIENIILLVALKIIPKELMIFDELYPYGQYSLPVENIETIKSGLSKIDNFETIPFELGILLRNIKEMLVSSVEKQIEIIVIGD